MISKKIGLLLTGLFFSLTIIDTAFADAVDDFKNMGMGFSVKKSTSTPYLVRVNHGEEVIFSNESNVTKAYIAKTGSNRFDLHSDSAHKNLIKHVSITKKNNLFILFVNYSDGHEDVFTVYPIDQEKIKNFVNQ